MEKTNDVGAILKAERECRGLTLEVIQEATKIPIDSLKAIEEGYKIRTLTSFYYKSFVRLYALHLGLDPLPILAIIPSYQSVKKIVSADRPNVLAKPDLNKIYIVAGHMNTFHWQGIVPIVLFIIIAGLVIGGSFVVIRNIGEKIAVSIKAPDKASPRELPKGKKGLKPEKIIKVEKVTRAEKVDKPVKVEKIVKDPDVVKVIKVEKMHDPVPQAVLVPASVPAAVEHKKAETVNTVEEVKPVKKVSLTVRATVTAWLTVKSDSSIVFKGSLKKGSSESWNAARKIEIWGKEVDQLEYEVNGKTIGKLGRKDSKARRIVVTPEGLSVEK